MTLEDIAHRIQANATVLNISILPALRAIDESTAGFPVQASMGGYKKDEPTIPGQPPVFEGWCANPERLVFIQTGTDPNTGKPVGHSEWQNLRCMKPRPCPDHDVAQLTQPEALSQQRDRARDDDKRLRSALREADKHLRIAADIAHYWGKTGDTTQDVEAKLSIADAQIWCANCLTHGHRNVKTNGNYCEFCSGFKSDFKQYKCYPPKAILDIHAVRRINVSDIQRVMRELKATAKNDKARQADDWRSKPLPERQIQPNPSAAMARRHKRLDGAA